MEQTTISRTTKTALNLEPTEIVGRRKEEITVTLDPLIHGKAQVQTLVGLEINDDKVELFLEDPKTGQVTSEFRSHKYWVLANQSHGRGWVRLKGDLFYKYGIQFSDKDSYNNKFYDLVKQKAQIFRIYDEQEACMVKDGYVFFLGMKHNEPSILSFDIEATGLKRDSTSKVLIISNTFRKLGQVTRKVFCYDEYKTQGEMLTAWCDWVREADPSIMVAHNGYSYDLPYLQHIADVEGVQLNLGRDGSPLKINERPSNFRIDGSRSQEYHKIRVYGRSIIDTMFLAIKYDVATKKYESYGLKSIIKAEGLEKKDRVFYDASQIRFKYQDPNEWNKIKEYCKDDSDDALALYDLMAPAFFYMSQSIPKTFQSVIESATGSQLNSIMMRAYLQRGCGLPKAHRAQKFEGAISFGEPGIYRNVFKVDVASLYPSIMIQCEVYDEDKDPDAKFLKLVKTFTEERLKNKALAKTSKYHNDLQSAQKILINSCYGFLGADGLLFNSPSGAEFITKTGRDILQMAIDWAKSKGLFVVNADTDSISFNKPDGSEITEHERKELTADLNKNFPERISWEDDGYYLTVVVLKAKNYVLWDGKKIKYKGSAIKATQKEPALKEFIKKIIDSIINYKEDFYQIYIEYVKEISNIKDIKRWATRKTISDKTLKSERTNEVRIREALEGSECVEGDRAYFYYKDSNKLELVERFNGIYDKERLYGKLSDTAWTFEAVLDCELLFPNFKLKRNKKQLEMLLTNPINSGKL